jgi:AraC-like DNA-binding protein
MSEAMRQPAEPARAQGRALTAETHHELLRLSAVAHSQSKNAAEARADLHRAIRKAHREGATISAIAVAAGLSTTRTHVIATNGKDQA